MASNGGCLPSIFQFYAIFFSNWRRSTLFIAANHAQPHTHRRILPEKIALPPPPQMFILFGIRMLKNQTVEQAHNVVIIHSSAHSHMNHETHTSNMHNFCSSEVTS